MYLDLIWIEIRVFKNSRNELTRPVMGTIFLVSVECCKVLIRHLVLWFD